MTQITIDWKRLFDIASQIKSYYDEDVQFLHNAIQTAPRIPGDIQAMFENAGLKKDAISKLAFSDLWQAWWDQALSQTAMLLTLHDMIYQTAFAAQQAEERLID